MNDLIKICGRFVFKFSRCDRAMKTVCNRRLYHSLCTNFNTKYELIGTQIPDSHHCPYLTISRTLAKSRDKPKHSKKGDRPKVMLNDDEMEQVIPYSELRIELDRVVQSLRDSFKNNLALRSNPASIDNLSVELKGTKYALNEIAHIARKSPHLVVINLANMSEALKPVLAAIEASGMNLNPQQEGTVIYLTVPKVTREHRELLAKNAKVLLQNAKDELRGMFSSFSGYAKKQTKAKISVELIFNVNENLKYIIDQKIAECETMYENKLNELLN